jgi:hypothetical protein
MPNKKSAKRQTGGTQRGAQARSKKGSRPARAAASGAKQGSAAKTSRKKKAAATANPFNAQFFPLPLSDVLSHEHNLKERTSAANFVGVCFSGGGSRALSAAMGQMRGLKYLNLLDEVFFISSVSGGTWASATYTYLPPQYDEDDFLGLVVDPGDLTLWNWNPQHPEYALNYLSPNNLGNVPPSLSVFNDLDAILQLKAYYGYQNNELWQGLVGSLILSRWGLWDTDDNGFPSQYYTHTPAYLAWKGGILDRNKQLKPDQFFCVRRQRPFYVMNGSIVSNPTVEGSQLLYFESTTVGVGVRNFFPGVGPGGRDIGGGTLEPFAMGSKWLKDLSARSASVSVPARPFSLADMAGISSAAFAETIQSSFPIELDGLIPKYPYWPVEGRNLAKNSAYNYEFADGGSLEDTGITSLLARTVPNIIAFVNGQTPLTQDGGEIVVDSQIQLLFGISPSAASLKYKEAHRRAVPNDDPAFTQVFASSDYNELAQGLWKANSGKYNGTAMYRQTLDVLPNANFGIKGNYSVRVLWVYNTWVDAWYELLTDDLVAAFAEAEAALNFPNYNTVLQLNLSASQVNLLAHLSCWNVISTRVTPQGGTNAEMVRSMFYG